MKQSKAKREARYRDAGIMAPSGKLDDDELQARLNQRSAVFQDRRTRRVRSRAASKKAAIQDF